LNHVFLLLPHADILKFETKSEGVLPLSFIASEQARQAAVHEQTNIAAGYHLIRLSEGCGSRALCVAK
jgi:hypothetical protein